MQTWCLLESEQRLAGLRQFVVADGARNVDARLGKQQRDENPKWNACELVQD